MVENAPEGMEAVVRTHPSGDEVAFHRHDFFQLTVAISGTVRIQTNSGWWLAMPGTAVLIAPGIEHRAIYPQRAELINMRFPIVASASVFQPAQMFKVSNLIIELVQEAKEIAKVDGDFVSEEADLIRQLLVKLLQKNSLELDMFVPEGQDKRLRIVTDKLRNDPGCTDTLAQLADLAHASQRTLARLFSEEIGMPFIRWRERLRVMTAIERMISGHSIIDVALNLGYQSASSFTTAFTRLTGMPPRQYMKILKL